MTDQEKLERLLVGRTIRVVRTGGSTLELTLDSTDPAVTLVISSRLGLMDTVGGGAVTGYLEVAAYGDTNSVRPTDMIFLGKP